MKKRLHIETVKVELRRQKIRFQVRIPRGVKTLLSIHTQSTAAAIDPKINVIGSAVGCLWLARPCIGDIFYSTAIYPARFELETEIKYPDFSPVTANIPLTNYKSTQPWFPVQLPENGPILEGFYADEIKAVNAKKFKPYTVTVYLEMEDEP